MENKNEKETHTSSSVSSSTGKEKGYGGGIGGLIKLLPTGTVFLFQFLNPVVTNSGECKTTNKYLCSILLAICSFNCLFTTFTDSYTGTDQKRHYGIVTTKGLKPLMINSVSDNNNNNIDLSKYRLKGSDFVHAALTLLVFVILGLLDSNTVQCFYPDFESTQKRLVQVLPPTVGAFIGWMFFMFPNHRHGIGYPVTTDSTHTTQISTQSPQNPLDNA